MYVLTEVVDEANAAVNKPLESQVQFVSESMVYQAAVVENRKDKLSYECASEMAGQDVTLEFEFTN